MTPLTALAYRLTLGDLTPNEQDLAFSWALKHHATGWRPTPGEILQYLHTAREETVSTSTPLLEQPEMSAEERSECLRTLAEIKARLSPLAEKVSL
jgi:hypothetical protein